MTDSAHIRDCIRRVATGPALSKDLTRADARAAMAVILDGGASAVAAGIYLIALRMKRESLDELLGGLDALLAAVAPVSVAVDELVTVADPFNGCVRGLPAAAFLPAVLAACGLPAYSHGLRAVAPKYGVTHHRVLAAAGVPVTLTPVAAAGRIKDPAVGWAYLDQSVYAPKLHRLVKLRDEMVKRTCLTTLEVLLGPLRAAAGTTQLITGYVHKDYPPLYARLARAAGYDGTMVVRGAEGGCVPPLNQVSRLFVGDGGDGDGDGGGDGERQVRLNPADAGVVRSLRAVPLPTGGDTDDTAAAAATADLGLAALAGDAGDGGVGGDAVGTMRDSLIYAAAICLHHTGRAADLTDGAEQARAAIDSGAAAARFDAGRR